MDDGEKGTLLTDGQMSHAPAEQGTLLTDGQLRRGTIDRRDGRR
jgi:hypothetical protein